MKPLAFIFTVDRNRQHDERRFEYMSLLLLDSIKRFNPDADVYCGVFSNRIPLCKDELLLREKTSNFHYIEDINFYCRDDVNAGYLRNYCCYYFSHVMDLTTEYDNVVYLDIDVILTDSFIIKKHSINVNEVLIEEFDEVIRFYECKNTTRFIGEHGKIEWYHNWIQIINKSNKHVFSDRSAEYGIHPKYFFSDMFMSYMFMKYKNDNVIILKKQTIGTIPFYSKYKSDHFCLHYDNFERRGVFICSKKMLSRVDYCKFLIKGEYYLKQKCKNDVNLEYWRNAVNNYKKYKPAHLKYYPEYDGLLI